ncbi:hypothetical protein BVH06_15540 [Pseudomonas sp. PA27(2017)]|nr:hypothetical protein BVH06_15540 [Pseudomonas sp. PA27(2017)]
MLNARFLLGKQLRRLLHDQYYFNGERSREDIGSLEWHIGDRETISMYLLSDGESVGANLAPLNIPVSFELGHGAFCSWKREDLLVQVSATHLVSTRIHEVEGILNSFEGQQPRLAGFRVTFETGDFLIFLNQGDDAAVFFNTLPPVCEGLRTRFVKQIED